MKVLTEWQQQEIKGHLLAAGISLIQAAAYSIMDPKRVEALACAAKSIDAMEKITNEALKRE